MTRKRTVTVPIEVTIYEPEDTFDEHGKRIGGSAPLFMIVSGGDYRIEGNDTTYNWGLAGRGLVAYLPGHRAVGLDTQALIAAALKHLEEGERYEPSD